MTELPANAEEFLNGFNRLIRELIRGKINRNTFQPWEIEFLLDIENCHIKESARENVLHRYQRSVQHQMKRGAVKPLKLSEFLERGR